MKKENFQTVNSNDKKEVKKKKKTKEKRAIFMAL
jgi:hypothetical protein